MHYIQTRYPKNPTTRKQKLFSYSEKSYIIVLVLDALKLQDLSKIERIKLRYLSKVYYIKSYKVSPS